MLFYLEITKNKAMIIYVEFENRISFQQPLNLIINIMNRDILKNKAEFSSIILLHLTQYYDYNSLCGKEIL